MRIRLLYFASFRDAAGRDEETRELAEGSTVAAVWEDLRREVPFFAKLSAMPPAAVNCEYAEPGRRLAEHDEVAFLPPVAGG